MVVHSAAPWTPLPVAVGSTRPLLDTPLVLHLKKQILTYTDAKTRKLSLSLHFLTLLLLSQWRIPYCFHSHTLYAFHVSCIRVIYSKHRSLLVCICQCLRPWLYVPVACVLLSLSAFILLLIADQDSSVSIVTVLRARLSSNRGSLPGRGKSLLSSAQGPDRLWNSLRLLSRVYWQLFLQG